MNSGLINIKNVSLVTMLAAASAAALYLLNSPQKTSKEKQKLGLKPDTEAINQMMRELQNKRDEILRKFEESNNRTIPKEMIETMDYIHQRDPRRHPPQIRLLCSQLIQDYAIMYTNIQGTEPKIEVIELAKSWLDFSPPDTNTRIEQINHRYALALRSRSIKEFRQLHKWLHEMDSSVIDNQKVHHHWVLRSFQCGCILGNWKEVLDNGRQLEKTDPEMLAGQPLGQHASVPLHPLHLFDYISLKLPSQSANFTQVYYNVERYINSFDPRLTPPLKFSEWQIIDCLTLLKFGFSTDPERHKELQEQITRAKPNTVENLSKFMFVYGCLVQYPCSWVQLPSGKDKTQPAVLCGPWNDTEMELTASYLRRRYLDGESEEEKQDPNKIIQVVRSDLRLHLDRSIPSMTGSLEEIDIENVNNAILKKNKNKKPNGEIEGENEKEREENNNKKDKTSNDNDNYHEMMDPSAQGMTSAVGWIWRGTFDHEEGLLEIKAGDMTNFEFRRDFTWKEKALKCSCRTWDISMIISTPD